MDGDVACFDKLYTRDAFEVRNVSVFDPEHWLAKSFHANEVTEFFEIDTYMLFGKGVGITIVKIDNQFHAIRFCHHSIRVLLGL